MPSPSAATKNSLSRVAPSVNLYSVVVGSFLCLFQWSRRGGGHGEGGKYSSLAAHFYKLQACFVYSMGEESRDSVSPVSGRRPELAVTTSGSG